MIWPSDRAGWVLADPDGGDRELLRTTDAGATWTEVAGVDATGAINVSFADANDGWLVGDKGVQSTHDGGATWATVTVPGGIASGAAVAAAAGRVHVAYIGSSGSALVIATSPVDHDAFTPASITIPVGAGPRLDVAMSAGGDFAELVYDDRTLIGAAEIRDGEWARWDLTCPYDNPTATAGLSPQGHALAIACSPSGFGDPASVVAANLSSGSVAWVTIQATAGDVDHGEALVDLATATDAGVKVVVFAASDGSAQIVSSTDGGATWPTRTPLPAGTAPTAIAHLPDGSLLLAIGPSGGLASADGLTWSRTRTAPTLG